MTFEAYMLDTMLMYFKVVVYDENGVYMDEFDNYELRNYKLDLIRKYSDFLVTNTDMVLKKNKGYTISTTTIHIKKGSETIGL